MEQTKKKSRANLMGQRKHWRKLDKDLGLSMELDQKLVVHNSNS